MNSYPNANIDELFSRAEQSARCGNFSVAHDCYEEILKISPENPRALNGLGNRALSRGDGASARDYFGRAIRQDMQAAPLWLNLALAQRLVGDAKAELQALDGALEADPYFIVALLQKAQWFERYDHRKDAVRAYRSLLDAAPPLQGLPAAMRQALEHGRAIVDADNAALLADIKTSVGSKASESPRFEHALEIMAGKRKLYYPKPAGLYFPYLPPVQYFDRNQFSWIGDLEAGTEIIKSELAALLEKGYIGDPYVKIAPNQPKNQWEGLNNSADWSALFIWRDGVLAQRVRELCPRTTELLDRIPMLDMPHRGPTAIFSSLKPHTHIPPHHGVTNIRSVVHLPLIVPKGCGFRVGSETREWQEGVAWVFDDTIEHEAWNNSSETRVILIVDVWNPYLTEAEKSLLRRANGVMHKFGQAQV